MILEYKYMYTWIVFAHNCPTSQLGVSLPATEWMLEFYEVLWAR